MKSSDEHDGPTVLLIGGTMVVDDGTRLDSRQPIEGDPECRTVRTCLAGSMLWWLTMTALVDRILDDAGAHAFALVVGARTLLEVQPDGSLRRTRTSSVVRGGLSTVELVRSGHDEKLGPDYEHAGEMDRSWSGASIGEVGLRYGEPRRRWRVLNGNEWYLAQAGQALQPAVIVDTTDSVLHDATFQSLEQRRLFSDQVVLVMPHTQASERYIKAYANREHQETPLQPLCSSLMWDPDAPPDPIRYTIPIPITASFGVTGLMQRDEWRDPSDIEAARKLLQARFDLRIGLWDLVRSPVLRRTLLDTVPTSPAPNHRAAIPPAAAKRARKSIESRIASTEAEAAARERITPLLIPLLKEGWSPTDRSTCRLDLSERFLGGGILTSAIPSHSCRSR